MAVDTRNKRASCIAYALGIAFVAPDPDGSLANAPDRQHIAYAYPGIGTALSASLSQTLGALTLSSGGTVAIVGTTSQTLGALTLSGTGTVAVAGALSQTLGALTLTASESTSSTTGAISKTLGAMTLSATGSAPLVWVPTTPTAGSWAEQTPAASSWTRVLH